MVYKVRLLKISFVKHIPSFLRLRTVDYTSSVSASNGIWMLIRKFCISMCIHGGGVLTVSLIVTVCCLCVLVDRFGASALKV